MNELKHTDKYSIVKAFINKSINAYTRTANDPKMIIANDNLLYVCNREDGELSLFNLISDNYPVAIIDRNKRTIIVSNISDFVISQLNKHIPSDYKVFATINPRCVTLSILSNLKAANEETIKWFILSIYKSYDAEFRAINGSRIAYNGTKFKLCAKINTNNPYNNTNMIKAFRCWIMDNKLTNSEILNDNHLYSVNAGGKYKLSKGVATIFKSGVFDKDEIQTLHQRFFYTRYVKGLGISFSKVVDDWTVPFVVNKVNRNADIRNVDLSNINIASYDGSYAPTDVRCNYLRYLFIRSDIEQRKAVAKLDIELANNAIDVFRRRDEYCNDSNFTYTEVCLDDSGKILIETKSLGLLIDAELLTRFDNVEHRGQAIKLKMFKGVIYTNNNFSVNAKEALKVYKLFRSFYDSDKEGVLYTRLDGHVYCDLYTVHRIVNDPGGLYIVVGCCHFYKDDIEDFIDYYKLNWRK